MASVDGIIKILSEQAQSYKRLLEVLREERVSLLDFNAEGVEELSKEKDTLVLRLRLLEEERIRLMSDFSDSNISLLKLSEITGNDSIKDIRLELISLLQSIEELNELNRFLIDRSLNYIRNTRNFFGTFGINCNLNNSGAFLQREA